MKLRATIWYSLILVSSALVRVGMAEERPILTAQQFSVLRSGDSQRLRETLDSGMVPNARDALGNTPIMLAATYGNVPCLRLLLERGAEVNATNAAGASALMRAAGDFDKVALLVQNGADVNARSGFGNTPLMLAARPWNSHRTVEFLLVRGADAKATNHWGASALMAAVAGGDETSVRLLLKHGADANAQPGMDPEAFVFGGARSPLMWAAYRGDLAMIKLLLDAGADVNSEGMMGTPLSQAAWANRTAAAQLLIERGAKANQVGKANGYTALHWAASTEEKDPSLVKLLLEHGADPNRGGGEQVDAFMDVLQTPLMLASRRGATPVLAALVTAGATNGTPDKVRAPVPPSRDLPETLDITAIRPALNQALPLLQHTSLESKKSFVAHSSRQDCTSCHQQHLPLAAIGVAKKQRVNVDREAERQLIEIVSQGELKNPEVDWQPLFHPDPAGTKGYELFAYAAEELPASEVTDAWVNHLAAIQGKEGQWYNNLPRPPIQTGDAGPTALAVLALQRYAPPGRKAEFAAQVERARQWLWKLKPENTETRIYQLLGLAWAGERPEKLQALAKALISEQRKDGGWAQLPGMNSDAYATGQALYALGVAAQLANSNPAIDRGRRYLLTTQLDDGSWHVRRRAFPFQPTMKSGFPHGRDSWISAAGTSWAVMALSLPDEPRTVAFGK